MFRDDYNHKDGARKDTDGPKYFPVSNHNPVLIIGILKDTPIIKRATSAHEITEKLKLMTAWCNSIRIIGTWAGERSSHQFELHKAFYDPKNKNRPDIINELVMGLSDKMMEVLAEVAEAPVSADKIKEDKKTATLNALVKRELVQGDFNNYVVTPLGKQVATRI